MNTSSYSFICYNILRKILRKPSNMTSPSVMLQSLKNSIQCPLRHCQHALQHCTNTSKNFLKKKTSKKRERSLSILTQLTNFTSSSNPLNVVTLPSSSLQGLLRILFNKRTFTAFLLAYSVTAWAARDIPIGNLSIPIDAPAWIKSGIQAGRENGVALFADYYGVVQGNPVGGLNQNVAYSHEVFFGGELDFNKFFHWQGASLMISGVNGYGRNLSQDIGNIFIVSEAYTQQSIALCNLALRQYLFDKNLEFRIGRIAAGQVFARLPAFALQVNGGINGNPRGLGANVRFTPSSGSTWGALTKVLPTKESYIASGIFQASRRQGMRHYNGVDFSIRPDDGTLSLLEAAWTPTFWDTPEEKVYQADGKTVVTPANPGLPAIYKLGAYYSNYTFSNFSGGTEDNAFGFYGMAQQMVWRSAHQKDHNFSIWAGATCEPQQTIARMPFMGFCGTIWQGLIPTRNLDQFLFTFLIGTFGNNFANALSAGGASRPQAETVLEWSYIIRLTENIALEPDVQWIIQPGGTASIPNALVLGLQAMVEF